jgi:hypothetical protein
MVRPKLDGEVVNNANVDRPANVVLFRIISPKKRAEFQLIREAEKSGSFATRAPSSGRQEFPLRLRPDTGALGRINSVKFRL